DGKANAKDAAKAVSKQATKAPAKDTKKEAAKPDPKPAAKVGSTGTIHAVVAGPRFAFASIETVSPADIAAVKEAISAVRKGQSSQAAELQKTISDPTARKLVEWMILRGDDSESIEFTRYMTFLAENPSWPAIGLLRRRAEATLWSDRLDPAFVRTFFAKERPASPHAQFALAPPLL